MNCDMDTTYDLALIYDMVTIYNLAINIIH